MLTNAAFYAHGVNYSNQFSNVWAGALAYLDLHPDDEIRGLLMRRLQQSMSSFQSTAGYFYEANGPDWSYNLGTHHSNLHMAFHYAKDPKIREMLSVKERAFSEWLAYNSVPDPTVDQYILNRGIECRQLRPSFERYGWLLSQGMPLTTVDPMSHAFTLDQQEAVTVVKHARAKLIHEWPKVDTLPVGDFRAFSPYTFLYRNHARYYPTPAERQAALAQLPVSRPPFVHQRYDARNKTVYTFVKTPTYYAVFNSGQKVRDQQRYGLGLLWSASSGAVLQSQTKETATAWGTRFHQDSLPLEGLDLDASFFMDGQHSPLGAGNRDLLGQNLSIRYDLNTEGEKTLEFLPDRIRVTITFPGLLIEHLPLLASPNQAIHVQSDKVNLPGGIKIAISDASDALLQSTHELIENTDIGLLRIRAQDRLAYEIVFQ